MKKYGGMILTLALASCVFLAGCGDDTDDTDGNTPDAAMSAGDAAASATSECGQASCTVDTQICVNDINMNESCVDLPKGCDENRQCETCGGACTDGLTCFNLPDQNTIACH